MWEIFNVHDVSGTPSGVSLKRRTVLLILGNYQIRRLFKIRGFCVGLIGSQELN